MNGLLKIKKKTYQHFKIKVDYKFLVIPSKFQIVFVYFVEKVSGMKIVLKIINFLTYFRINNKY